MKCHTSTGSKRISMMAAFSIFFLLASGELHAELGLRLPEPQPRLPSLLDISKQYIYSIGYPIHLTHTLYPKSSSKRLALTKSSVTVTYRLGNYDIFFPRLITFDEYLSERSKQEMAYLWNEYSRAHITTTQDQAAGRRGIVIETPRIKSDAFRRVFGGETMSLTVTGDITIDGGMRHEKRSGQLSAANRAPSTNFQMKQTQRFKVEGKIGENVSVFVDQDSERPFEFENAIKLRYSSDEDGIIKSIEAGNVALSLPGTRFVTFSAQNAGLFGVKTEMKVGNLDITAIASMEKGQKKKLSLSGGKVEDTFQIQDYEYKKGTYFFLDYYYRDNYTELDNNGNHLYNPDSAVVEIEVYKSDYNYEFNADAIKAWALFDVAEADTSVKDQEHYKGDFLRLDPSEYYINKELGFIALNSSVQNSEVLAVSYKTSDGTTHGQLLREGAPEGVTPIFKLLKPRSPQPSDATWFLEWKNVYNLGGRNIDPEGFELKLFYKPPSGDPLEALTIDGQATGFLHIFGLDNINESGQESPDNIIDIDPNIISLARGELIFPNLRPFDPEDNDPVPFPDEMENLTYRTRAIYDTTATNYIRQQSKFYIQVNSSRRSPNYSLGMNVIEGTEEVMLNGMKLVKDRDYTIDYFSGTLTLLKDEATSPNANIDISYESQQLFAIDKKTLMGARAEYTLWEEGNNRSFIGATLLYMNQRTIDQRIRIGRDAPMNNLVWDVNTALNFEPAFITRALDALPLLSVSSPSSISLEAEVAQVIPNPNTLNNETTGDFNGVAYLDDFEGAKRQVNLGVIRSNWALSSPPTSTANATGLIPKRGHLIWYNPYEQVHINDIWPDREVTTNFGGTTRMNVLTIEFQPRDDGTFDPEESWGGLMKPLSAGYHDQKDSRFLEVWVKGDHGRVHIDLGRISEDTIPNQKLDTEDKRRNGLRNNLLDEDEDTGLDGMDGLDPIDPFHPHEAATVIGGVATPYDFWDMNGDSVKQETEPWSFDDWEYTTGSIDYSHINGTENNRDDGIAIYPDSEDQNRNGDVDYSNDYFSYSFSLDPASPDTMYIAGGKGNPKGWLLYRIPLDHHESPTVGNPDWSRIEYARVWIDEVDPTVAPNGRTIISIAEINLAGNEWKLRGVVDEYGTAIPGTDSTMAIAVINTHDNPEYEAPPGVEGVIDPIQKIRSKEQSLIVQLTDLRTGETALAEKQFYQGENLINYHKMRMFVHGGDATHMFISPDDSVEFFLRWGSDTNNEHYYEVRLPVFPNWDEQNNIEVFFEDLSRLKLTKEAYANDVVDVNGHLITVVGDTASEVLDNGHLLTVIGEPSLTNIRWLMIGVTNVGSNPFTGEVWLNELRLSDVRKDRGMAMRARADLRLSDFISVSGEYNRKDADFHTVNERFGGGANSVSGNVAANIQLHKLLPTSWGISIPVSANYSQSLQTPKYEPGSDILVNKSTATPEKLREIETYNNRKGLNISFSKRTKSRNFFVRYLVDPIKGSFNFTKAEMHSSQIRSSEVVGLKGSFSYDLNFGDQNYWEPLKWLGTKGFLKKVAATKFYYLPSSIGFRMTGNDNQDRKITSGGVNQDRYTANVTRDMSVSLRPFTAITVDFSLNDAFDMRVLDDANGSANPDSAQVPVDIFQSRWNELFSSFSPGEATARAQRFNAGFNPKIFQWLTTNFKYSANYNWANNLAMRSKGTNLSARINNNVTFSGTFDPRKLTQSFKKKRGLSTAGRSRRPVTRRRPGEESIQPKSEEKKKEKGKSPLLLPVVFVGKILEKIDPISISISETKSANHFGIKAGHTPSQAYQFGWTLDPDVEFSENVTQRNTTKQDRRITLRSGFKITPQLTTKLDYEYSTTNNQSTQATGTVTQSVFVWKDNVLPLPNWSIQWRGLEKLPLLNKIAKSISLSHTFSGKMTETWNDSTSNITQETISRDFRPLAGASISFKNGITANIQYTTGETIQKQILYGEGRTKRLTSNLSISAQYRKRGGIKLPFFKKVLDNNIDFSLTFTKSYNATFQKKTADGEYEPSAETKNWSFQPKITYSFTSTLQGGMHLELGEREDLRAGKTKITGFGINARISLAGR